MLILFLYKLLRLYLINNTSRYLHYSFSIFVLEKGFLIEFSMF